MANKKIYADLTAASSVVATDVIPVVQNVSTTPVTKSSTLQKLIDLFLGGSTPTLVHSAELLANAATDANTASAIVKRDASKFFTTEKIIFPGSDTYPAIKGPGDTMAGLLFYTSAQIRVQRSTGGTFLELGGAGTSFYKTISQYDQNIFGNLPSTGWHRFGTVTQVGNTAATLTDLFNKTLPAGTYSTNGSSYTFESVGSFTASTGQRLLMTYGGTTVLDTGTIAVGAASGWRLKARAIRRSSSVAIVIVRLACDDPAVTVKTVTTVVSVTTTADIIWKLQGNGTNANDTVQEWASIKFDWESWN